MLGILLLLIAVLIFDVLPKAYTILVISGLFTVLIYKYDILFKKSYLLYIISLVLSILSVVYYKEIYFKFIVQGLLGYAAFLIVMMVGVLPNKWTISRKIKRYRGELSIAGFILITPHALLRIFGVISSVDIFGIAAIVIMIPLTIISFKFVRKEIDPKDWFRIQKGAYAIYVILFIHLISVSAWENKIVYAVLLTLYINNKILKEIRR